MTRRELLALYRMYDPDEEFVGWEDVVKGVRLDHPDWPEARILVEADRIFHEIELLDGQWYHSQERYQQNTVPWDDTP